MTTQAQLDTHARYIERDSDRKIRYRNKLYYRFNHWPIWIFVFFLARIGIVTPAFLLQKFKYAVLIAFIFAAVITPTPDMVTQFALAVPMIVLYLIGVGVAYLFAKPIEA